MVILKIPAQLLLQFEIEPRASFRTRSPLIAFLLLSHLSNKTQSSPKARIYIIRGFGEISKAHLFPIPPKYPLVGDEKRANERLFHS
jgi:hypothetical protein